LETGAMPEVHTSASVAATETLGEELAGRLRGGDVVLLEGDLAAGKTTLVRGAVRALGGDDTEVNSPTFVLLLSYPCTSAGIVVFHHVDLYRLGDQVSDLREIGIEEILSEPDAVVAVEWPKDTLARWIPSDARVWRVRITTGSDDSRSVEVFPPV
jgi:tRNA threonylcarbamoyl adenosine modification protein YjeE